MFCFCLCHNFCYLLHYSDHLLQFSTRGYRCLCCTSDCKIFGHFWLVIARNSEVPNITRTLQEVFMGSIDDSFESFAIHPYNEGDFQKSNLTIHCYKLSWHFLPFPDKEGKIVNYYSCPNCLLQVGGLLCPHYFLSRWSKLSSSFPRRSCFLNC